MSEDHSTSFPADNKPAKISKPRPDFPLSPHPAGYWCKKIRGTLHYFGPRFKPGDAAAALAVADAALADYNQQSDALHSGRKPRADPAALTAKELVNLFLAEKQSRVDTGELSQRTWDGYKQACDEIIAAFGKGRLVADLNADDFASLRKRMANKWGPVRLGNVIQNIRSAFKHAYDAELIDRAVRFGPSFKKPSKKTLRLHRVSQGLRLFTTEEVRKLLDAASVQMRAMMLLGVNAGLGNTDCGALPLTAINLDTGWLDYPRTKTGIPRRCPLWPETVQAIKDALAKRPNPKNPEHAALIFVTKYGDGWAQTAITHEMRKLLNALGINGHRNFYTLRHTFRTVADESKDQVACDHIMGHARDDMASVYRERISDERLRAVTDHVRGWLFGSKQTL